MGSLPLTGSAELTERRFCPQGDDLGDDLLAHLGPDFCSEVVGLANGHLDSKKMLIEPLLEAGAAAEYGNSHHFRTFLRGTGQLARGQLSAFDPLVYKGVASGNVALEFRRSMKPAPQAGCANNVIAASIFQTRDDMTCPRPAGIHAQPQVEGKGAGTKWLGRSQWKRQATDNLPEGLQCLLTSFV
jgi:hypothetical protein